jgi:hypothetical protein
VGPAPFSPALTLNPHSPLALTVPHRPSPSTYSHHKPVNTITHRHTNHSPSTLRISLHPDQTWCHCQPAGTSVHQWISLDFSRHPDWPPRYQPWLDTRIHTAWKKMSLLEAQGMAERYKVHFSNQGHVRRHLHTILKSFYTMSCWILDSIDSLEQALASSRTPPNTSL